MIGMISWTFEGNPMGGERAHDLIELFVRHAKAMPETVRATQLLVGWHGHVVFGYAQREHVVLENYRLKNCETALNFLDLKIYS